MGKYFSDVVDKAIEDIYYCYDSGKAEAAADALLQAAKEGDGDACYFLSRCFSGTCYSWDYHPFTENEAAAYAMLFQAVSQGSAAAVLGALRMDMLTPEMQEAMPFGSVKEAWEVIRRKAEDGCLFCQYLIGNTYYYLDVIEIEDRKEREFESQEAWNNWLREQMEQSIPLFESAFSGGMGLAGRNLRNYYGEGRGALIRPDYEKKMEVIRRGAELGYPEWMYELAFELFYHQDKAKEALPWARGAVEKGHLFGWHIIGDIYRGGEAVERDFAHALECYLKTADYGNDPYACRRAGEMYFHGLGTATDYARAVHYLEQKTEKQGDEKLGICYLLGYGCRQDVSRGRALLESADETVWKNYGLGIMYAEGIGVPEDIAKGVEYLKAAGNCEPAREALKHYKRSLFGVWRRR